MARLFPDLMPSVRQDGGLYRELQVIEHLRAALPEGYEIFHSVAWHSIHEGMDHHGEIDIVVMSPNACLLLLEVKAGDVILRQGGIFKLYADHKEHDVAKQCRVQFSALLDRLQKAGLHPFVTNCLVLPDYEVRGDLVAFPRERIIDASDYAHIGQTVMSLLAGGNSTATMEQLRHFLGNVFRVSPSLDQLKDQLRATSRQLADGLATWVPRISAPSGTIRIQATAGSGKTQLALRLLEDAASRGQNALYVCFNRPLADHVARIAPPQVQVTSFHELCVDHYRRRVGEPDFREEGIFSKVAEFYLAPAPEREERFDLMILDEGQDFEPAWVAGLLPQLKADGRLYLMEDEDQKLYERDGFDLAGAVLIRCDDNFRTPRALCQIINAFGLSSAPVTSQSPWQGEFPDFHVYDSDRTLVTRTAQAVEALLERGVAMEDIVVLTARGHQRSVLLNSDEIGRFRPRRFTGEYTRDGNPVWTPGDLLVESVYRFKGQSMPAVVLSELDFATLDERERRKLFVGLTRAQLMASIVLTPRAEACIAALL
jgi:hypothetical protein